MWREARRVFRQCTLRRLAQIEAGSAAHQADDHVLYSIEGRGTVAKAVGADQTLNTLLNRSTEHVDVVGALNMQDVSCRTWTPGKASSRPLKSQWYFMETRPGRDEQDHEKKEEIEGHSGEEDPCPPLDETLATSWIAQIGERSQRDGSNGFPSSQ